MNGLDSSASLGMTFWGMTGVLVGFGFWRNDGGGGFRFSPGMAEWGMSWRSPIGVGDDGGLVGFGV